MTNREAFEAWADSEGYILDRDFHGMYEDLRTYHAWNGWQAATARLQPPDDIREAMQLIKTHPQQGASCLNEEQIYRLARSISTVTDWLFETFTESEG